MVVAGTALFCLFTVLQYHHRTFCDTFSCYASCVGNTGPRYL